MIIYEYTDTNRLRKPHKYMYTPYHGGAFINSYLSDRDGDIRRFESQASTEELVGIERYLCESSVLFLDQNCHSLAYGSSKSISYFDKKDRVTTEELLLSLLGSQLSNTQDESLKYWVDFLVQRFEVTKKLYEIYHSNNLRKGGGEAESVRLYWLFSLLLTLFYSATNNIKYLSTTLKINDLICSLDDDLLKNIPKQGILLVLSNEVDSINLLFSNINGGSPCS